MANKQKFIDFVQSNLFDKIDNETVDKDILEYWGILTSTKEKEKPLFTDNGKLILGFLQKQTDKFDWTAKEIAEELFISSRTVSGAIRKLVTDGFVDKVSQDPVIYVISNSGKNINIEEN